MQFFFFLKNKSLYISLFQIEINKINKIKFWKIIKWKTFTVSFSTPNFCKIVFFNMNYILDTQVYLSMPEKIPTKRILKSFLENQLGMFALLLNLKAHTQPVTDFTQNLSRWPPRQMFRQLHNSKCYFQHLHMAFWTSSLFL